MGQASSRLSFPTAALRMRAATTSVCAGTKHLPGSDRVTTQPQEHALTLLATEIDDEWIRGLEITEHDLPQEFIDTLFCSEFTETRR
ncbi:hypothetical protein LepocDRAFT_00003020 [Leptothrix ochracea L12]|uniref:Uncharacterized protein n=1 Tax=Leptothrix ochracea L12 TaxID=735332 RepID=I4Z5S8_9BURK|nr:hypothetical protein LepocDRAFT_00003020 [Leptothrix ochracea L12]